MNGGATKEMREALLRVQTEIIYALLVGGLRLPDPVLARMLKRFHRLALLLSEGEDEELIPRIEELEEYFRTRSPLSEALRRMILDARPSQMKSIIRGYLVNYVYEW